MVRFKKWIQLDFGILQISLHVYVGIIEGDALIREYESNCYKYVSYTLLGIGKDMILVSIILIRFIGWIGYIPFHYPDMRIQINWYHLVDLQGNKREFWISFHNILTLEEIPYISRDTSIEDIARIKILSPSGIML